MKRILSFLGFVVWIMVVGTLVILLIDYAPLSGYAPLNAIRIILGTNGIVAVLIVVGLITALSIIRVGYRYEWTGFGESTYRKPDEQEVRPKKTLWDWLQLLGTLAIPVVVAAATAWFSLQQNTTQTQIEEQRAQDEALQAYLDQMSTLLLEEKDLRNDRVSTLMTARTITALGRLDPNRKTQVMRFLIEADLVQRVDGKLPVISLNGADLSDTDLSAADLSGAYLNSANLRDANLRDADLSNADLIEADLRYADLYLADLPHAYLNHADLRDANLSATNLSYTDLLYADLRDANLSDADWSFADLRNVHERAKDKKSSRMITNEEIEQQSPTLEDATMPNGQKYDEWLKSNGSGEDGENDGSP